VDFQNGSVFEKLEKIASNYSNSRTHILQIMSMKEPQVGQKLVKKLALQNSNLFADLWELFVKYCEIKALLVPSKTLTLDDPNPYPTSTAC
jgi:hypothetical protein